MSANVIRIPITNIYAGGDYTGTIYVGSKKTPAIVLLDTGSSTLAVEEKTYNPKGDPSTKITDMIQEVAYEDGSHWMGAVVETTVYAGTKATSTQLKGVNLAVAYSVSKTMFGKYNGILGLAYSQLNEAYVMPGPTFPPKHNYNEVQNGKTTLVTPYFTQLESAGVVANKFAFYTLRSMTSMAMSNPAKDPLNNGFLILGGGEESTDLYTGAFQNIRVLDDDWYNTNLISVTVGKGKPIPVPAVTRASKNLTNSIIDSGTNSLFLAQNLFDAIQNAMGPKLSTVFKHGRMLLGDFNAAQWPDITFTLEGATGKNVNLVVTPGTYWQTNAGVKGDVLLAIEGDGGAMQGQSILGLPLMNNYFMIFDRSQDNLGVISCAQIAEP